MPMTEEELDVLFGQGLAEETGDLVPLPAMPLLNPPPGPDEPSVAQAVEQGRMRQTATGEVDQVAPELDDIRIGDEVEIPGGTVAAVSWIDPKRKRLAVGHGRHRTYVSLTDVEEINGRRVADAVQKQRRDQAAEEGTGSPSASPKMPSKISLPDGMTLFPHQIENVEFISEKGRGLIADEMGLGKAQPLDARVLTPSGWVRLGDIRVGDQVVDPDTGRGARVTGVFERGERDCYRVTMSDGSSTECCDEHLWTVQTPTDKYRGNRWRTMSLSEFMGDLHQQTARGDRRRKWFVPLVAPVAGEPLDLPIDPYLLGLLLGDGTMPGIQQSGALGSPYLSTEDEEIVRMAQDALPPGLSLKKTDDDNCDYRITRDSMKTPNNAISRALLALGLASCSSPEKFVPDIYLRASTEARMALLQGLCDTDGSWTGSAVEFATTSPSLRDAVVELTYSLGGFCSVYEKASPSYVYKGEHRVGRPAWRVYLRTPENPFRLPRKASAWRTTNLARGFESVEHVGKKQMRCIAVDSQRNLYVTDGYIVTHNTISALVCIQAPAVIVCPALLKVNWAREINKWLPELTVTVVGGTKDKPDAAQRRADVVVINYDILHAHAGWIGERANRTIVADEAHYLKNLDIRWDKASRSHKPAKGSPRRAVAFHDIQQGVPGMLLLTGTPILNRVRELFPLLHLLDPQEWGSGYKFCMRYCAGHYEFLGRRRIFKCDGRSNMDELHERINGVYMMRHTKEAELKNLPPKSRGSIAVSLSKTYATRYRKARDEFLSWLVEQEGEEAVGRALQAEALVKLNKLRAICASGKAEAAVRHIVDHFESTGRPLVVMGVHRDAFELVGRGLDEVNKKVAEAKRKGKMPPIAREIRWDMVVGGQAQSKRQAAIDAFQDEGTLDVLLYSIPIATGTTLTRSSEVLFIERMWRPADQLQAEDRVHRIGQDQKVQITYLDAEGTIDMKLAHLLMEKSETAAAVIDGVDLTMEESAALVLGEMTAFGGGSGDAFESLRELVSNPAGEYGSWEADEMYMDIGPLGPTPVVFDEDGQWADDDGAEDLTANPGSDLYEELVDEGFVLDSWGDPQ